LLTIQQSYFNLRNFILIIYISNNKVVLGQSRRRPIKSKIEGQAYFQMTMNEIVYKLTRFILHLIINSLMCRSISNRP